MVYLFVACLPFSRYAFVEPTLDMRQEAWLAAHVAMYEWFGGSTPRLVPDNLKTGVIRHPREGEVVLNEQYRRLADHYNTAILPARVKRPKDKPSVENTVWHTSMAVIAGMRNHSFGSLNELRNTIREWLHTYNMTPFQKREESRQSVFEQAERPVLLPLPAVGFEIAQWSYARKMQANCHVAFQSNWYSVPYAYVGRTVDIRMSASRLEVWADSTRLSSHVLLAEHVRNRYVTNANDLPEKAKWHEWDRTRVMAWAQRVGPYCEQVTVRIFESVRFNEQGLGAALAVLRLSQTYSTSRLETACSLALSAVHSPRYKHLKPILETRTDQADTNGQQARNTSIQGFVRGSDYYGQVAS